MTARRVRLTSIVPPYLAVGGVAIAISFLTGGYWAYVINTVAIFSLVALSFVVLSGYLGQMSLAQTAFMGVGALVQARLVAVSDLPFLVALPVTLTIVALTAVLIGLPALRLRGVNLAILSFGFAVVAERIVFQKWLLSGLYLSGVPFVRSELGSTWFENEQHYSLVVIVTVTLLMIVTRALGSSRWGLLVYSVRDGEATAALSGVSPTRVKLSTFVLSGCLAGVAGILYGLLLQRAGWEDYSAFNSITYLAMSVVGGLLHPLGALLGGLLYFGVPQVFSSVSFLRGSQFQILSGVLAVAVLVIRPGGLVSLVLGKRSELHFATPIRVASGPSAAASPVIPERVGRPPAPRAVNGNGTSALGTLRSKVHQRAAG
ncbi:MAG: branched-chain amino acid ABC transporter permease [Actinomycetota bacterium]